MANTTASAGMRLDVAGQQVAGDDSGATTVDHHGVDQLDAIEQPNPAEADLAGQLLVGAEQQLLSGLATRVERAADLCSAERAVVEQAAVFAGERHALGDHLIDDVDADLCQAMHVALTGSEVTAFDRVVEQAMHRVAVAAIVLRRVDAALGGDRVGARAASRGR